MNIDAFKIGSGNIMHKQLLMAIGKTHLPVIASTGMSDMKDTVKLIRELRYYGCQELAILHCISLYPTTLAQTNLSVISNIKNLLQVTCGFSDHTEETITGALAICAGADILEKHLTLDSNLPGPDHKMSMTPDSMQEYIKLARLAAIARGNGNKQPVDAELQTKMAVGMSLVSIKDIPAGTVITEQMLTAKRPGTGISANSIDNIIGKRTLIDIKADQIIIPQMIDMDMK